MIEPTYITSMNNQAVNLQNANVVRNRLTANGFKSLLDPNGIVRVLATLQRVLDAHVFHDIVVVNEQIATIDLITLVFARKESK
jgi:hypothetical protein